MMDWKGETARMQLSTTRNEMHLESRQIRVMNSEVVNQKNISSHERKLISSGFVTDEIKINGLDSRQASNGVDREISMFSSRNRYAASDANSDAGSESSAADLSRYRHHRRSSGGSLGRRGSTGSNASQGSATKVSSVTLSMRRSPFPFEGQASDDKSRPGVVYNITMRVGEVKVAGSDGNVYIKLFGTKANSRQIQLRHIGDRANQFVAGGQYMFTVTEADIGKIERIKLSHDHMDWGSGFFVNEVEINVPSQDENYRFPCLCWLAQETASETSNTDNLYITPPEPDKVYGVAVRLGKVLDPQVKLYLQLCGENKRESNKIVLRPSGSAVDFLQPNKTYKFSVEMPTIGKLDRIRIGHDSQPSKGVFLDDVEVTPYEEDPVYFPASCWLVADKDDGNIEREIFAGSRAPEPSVDSTHEVIVILGEVLNPNSSLYVYLIGEKGDTSRVYLRPEGPLSTDRPFRFTLALTVDIGKIEKIRLGQDSTGYSKGLFVEEVRVAPVGEEPVIFPCSCWFAEDVWDSKTERELLPGQPVQRPENVAYNLTFKTGDMLHAGTDANVTLQLYGDKGQTEKIMLRQDKGKTLQRFDTGRTDRFNVQTMDVGTVQRVLISHDNTGANPEWFLERLTIEVPSRGEKYLFACNRWFMGDKDDAVDVEVFPEPDAAVYEPQIAVAEESQNSAAPEPEMEPPQSVYTVSYMLGKVRDPYSDLHVVLVGDHGETGKIIVGPQEGSKLVSGKRYTVTVQTVDVGKVHKIYLGQEARGPGSGVFVEEVEVIAGDSKPIVFPCRCWLAEDEDDGKTVRGISPGESVTSPYDISFKLGEVQDPQAKLYTILYGDSGESGRVYLTPTDGSGFVPGKLYRVSVNIQDIGKIKEVYLGQEIEGKGGRLFVEEIEVTAAHDKPVIFPCRCWVTENEADGKTGRILVPGETVSPENDCILYNMTFETGDVPFAGTDATVFVQMFGDKGSTEKIEFDQEEKRTSPRFEKGRIDKFAVETTDIGKLEKIRVGQNNEGRSPEWFLKELSIEIPSRNERLFFPYNNWIAGEDVDLDPVDEKSKSELYTIHIKLGDVSDPTAPIYIQLIGERGESGRIQMKPGYSTDDRFEKGRTYKVVARVSDIGKIVHVHVGQDQTAGSSGGLFVEEVEVTSSRGDRVLFPCRCWTVEEEDKVSVEDHQQKDGLPDIMYQVIFKTGERPNSGTDANVYFQLVGKNRETERIQLREKPNLQLFEAGGSDKFKVETWDVGKIQAMRVGHDKSGPSPDWYLEEVMVDVPDREENYVFPCHRWIVGDESEVELQPEEGKPFEDIDYRVAIKTGTQPGSGTDANVYLQLFGDSGQTEKFLLREEGDNRRFEKGRTDKFVIRSTNVGKIHKLRVSRDKKGVKGWLLEKITLDIPEQDEHYLFNCNHWLVESEPEEEFHPETRAREEDAIYTVTVQVGDVLDPLVSPYYQIIGSKGETSKIMLREGYSRQHVFEKDKSYKVSIRCQDIGEVHRLRIGDESNSLGKTMYVKEITVSNARGDEVAFPCRCWLGRDDVGKLIAREVIPGEEVVDKQAEDISYHVTIKTGDKLNAGTGANVFLQLCGQTGNTPKILLEDERKNFRRFERGRADKFVVQTVDVGQLDKLVVGHDNCGGRDSGWFLEEVDVDIPHRNERYVFKCGGWLAYSDREISDVVLFPASTPDEIEGPVKEEMVFTMEDAAASTLDEIEGPVKEEMVLTMEDAADVEQIPLHDGQSNYDLEFKTGDEDNAGTDARVFFQLFGEEGQTEVVDVGGRGSFTRTHSDIFRIRTKDVGRLKLLRVGHDNSGSSSPWLLKEVIVFSAERGERYVFKCDRWLGGRNNVLDLPLDSSGYGELVGREPDIPDLLDFMQSNDTTKIIHAASYLQHLCYSDDKVKSKVRTLGGIVIIVQLLSHNNTEVRYAALCLLRNLSYSIHTDEVKHAIAECDALEVLMDMLQRTERIEHREAIMVVIRNLSGVESLRIRILQLCLHLIVVIIIRPYSGWDKTIAKKEPTASKALWPAVLVHATRIIRNLSAGSAARQQLRAEEFLVDCLVWIIRIGVKNEDFNNKGLEHSVCTLRNLSYRLESEIDRNRYTDNDVNVDPATVKEQQSQGCFAGCGGGKSKKKASSRRLSGPKDQPRGLELLWQPSTVKQYFVLLRKANNFETLEGSAGALHNLTACCWKWAIKVRADCRKEDIFQALVNLLNIDYDPTIRAGAIALRNLAVDPANKRLIGEKAMVPLVNRLPARGEVGKRLIQDLTISSLLCTIHQLTAKDEKNAKLLRKTPGIRKMVGVASNKTRYSSPVIRTANQALAKLWVNPQLQQQMKSEGWQFDPNNPEINSDPMDYETPSQPQTPTSNNRRLSDRSQNYPNASRSEYGEDSTDRGWNGTSTPVSERGRSWGEGVNQIPPPYVSDDEFSRGAPSREDSRLEEISRRSASSRNGDQGNDRVHKLEDHGGKDADVWV